MLQDERIPTGGELGRRAHLYLPYFVWLICLSVRNGVKAEIHMLLELQWLTVFQLALRTNAPDQLKATAHDDNRGKW